MHRYLGRRLVLGSLAAATAGGLLRPAAAVLAPTPRQTKGPFYPLTLPLDSDNDLVRVAGGPKPALGTVTHVAGRILASDGRPVAGARVEIWQCDANGRYHHPGDRNPAPADDRFQGYGQALTDADGAYRFRTIRPVPYPGRTPHIHFRVTGRGFSDLVTQMYVEGEPGIARDFLYGSLDPQERTAVTVRLDRAADGKALAGRFEIVVRA